MPQGDKSSYTDKQKRQRSISKPVITLSFTPQKPTAGKRPGIHVPPATGKSWGLSAYPPPRLSRIASYFSGESPIGEFTELTDDHEGLQKFRDAMRLGTLEPGC